MARMRRGRGCGGWRSGKGVVVDGGGKVGLEVDGEVGVTVVG